MTQYIDKAAVVAEITKRISERVEEIKIGDSKTRPIDGAVSVELVSLLSFLDTLEVKKEVEVEYKQLEYSYFYTTYQRGKKHRWNVGSVLADYRYSSDCEGEHIFGQIVNVELDKEQDDWLYTFEGGAAHYEKELLESVVYVKMK